MDMKALNYSFLTALALSICLQSCEKANLSNNETEEEAEYITLSLGISGDGNGTETRSDSDVHLYGINVFYDSKKDGNIDTHYAYGLFDNKQDMTIQLLSGYKYRFSCTMVKNGKSLLYCGQYGSNTFSGYAKPFQTDSSPSTKLSNAFVYGTTYLSGIATGTATLKSSTSSTGYVEHTIPSIERYFGQVTDYTPIVGGTVVIPLKKTVFAARFIIASVPEGTLSGSCSIKPDKTSYYDGTEISAWSGSTNNVIYDSGAKIYSYPDVYDCWKNESTLNSTVTWDFTSSTFNQWNQSGTKAVSFKRNVLTTVTIACTPDNAKGSIVLDEETIGEDNNINMYLNSDGVIVIGIDPQPED